MSDRVIVSVADGVADVRLNRADKRNALDGDMFVALAEVGQRLITESGVRAVVLSGEGPSFCAGLDFASFQTMAGGGGAAESPRSGNPGQLDEGRITHLGQQTAWVWQEVPVPVIAAVHGHALGGGLQIALGRGHPHRAPEHPAVGARGALGPGARHDRDVRAVQAGPPGHRPGADVHGAGRRRARRPRRWGWRPGSARPPTRTP